VESETRGNPVLLPQWSGTTRMTSKGKSAPLSRLKMTLHRRTSFGFALLLVSILMGCGLWSTRRGGEPGVTKGDYKEACGACHNAPRPRTRSDDEWQAFVLEHRFYSSHDQETAQLYADYLKANN
jgi:hypothetical protein